MNHAGGGSHSKYKAGRAKSGLDWNMATKERIAELDGLRAAAIILVVLWHYVGIPLPDDYQISKTLFALGRSGVDLFFILSGFLIARILISNRDASNFFSAFYLRRALRILPVYYLVFFFYLAGRRLGFSQTQASIPDWSYILFLQNFHMAALGTYGSDWLAATWSLAVEEQFYLFFPLIVWLIPSRLLPRVLVVVIGLAPLLRLASYLVRGDGWAAYVLFPCRADALALGALVAHYAIAPGFSAMLLARRTCIMRCCVCLTAGVPLLAWVGPSISWTLWGHSFLSALYCGALLLCLAYQGTPQTAFLRSGTLAFIASISYAAYLVHPIAIELAFKLSGRPKTLATPVDAALIVLAVAGTLVFCSASLHWIERPANARGPRLEKSTGASMAG